MGKSSQGRGRGKSHCCPGVLTFTKKAGTIRDSSSLLLVSSSKLFFCHSLSSIHHKHRHHSHLHSALSFWLLARFAPLHIFHKHCIVIVDLQTPLDCFTSPSVLARMVNPAVLLATGILGFGSLVSALRLRSDPADGIFPAVQAREETPDLSDSSWSRCSRQWRPIARELKYWFRDNEGYCSELAAQAIRLPFHDCFPDGGCDGSIILTDECTTRRDNRQMIPICGVLYNIYRQYDVGAADLINFAACESSLLVVIKLPSTYSHIAAIANRACPKGVCLPFYVGRKDRDVPSPLGQIPPPTAPAPGLIRGFARRNFTSDDLVALVGAHSVGSNLSFVPFDTSPGVMDSTTYYSEVLIGDAPTTLPSDKSLSTYSETTDAWQEYARDQWAWDQDFTEA